MVQNLTVRHLTCMVQWLRFRDCTAPGSVGQIQECLPRQFRNVRVWVSQESNQHAQPAKFAGLDADDGNGFDHAHALSGIFSTNPANYSEATARVPAAEESLQVSGS
jgi:hypothetical protein